VQSYDFSAEKVKEAFDRFATTYDIARKQLIPCFDDLYQMVLALVPFQTSDEFSVLDLGAGTGLLSSLIADSFPRAQITLFDISEKMINQAHKRFAPQIDRFSFMVGDYCRDEPFGRFDLIISAFSIHHLPDSKKKSLFRKIFSELEPGGFFINADQVLGATTRIEEIYQNQWFRQVRAGRIDEADFVAALERKKEDRLSKLEDQLGWLRETGFLDVNCWYKNFSFVVYSGRKKPSP
jgi:tRNA (cmo5U34)-methyltransferase